MITKGSGVRTSGSGPLRVLSLWLPVAIIMALIWNASALPSSPGPSGMPDWLQHGLAYFTLSIVAVRAFAGGRWAGVTCHALAAGWLLASLYGLTDEWHQMYVPGRFSELRDLMADAVGALAGAALLGAWGIIAAGAPPRSVGKNQKGPAPPR